MAKSKIIITWDRIHGLPQAKLKNVSTEDISDASIFLKGTILKQKYKKVLSTTNTNKKHTNKLFRFIRRLFAEIKFSRTEKYFCKEYVAPFPIKSR